MANNETEAVVTSGANLNSPRRVRAQQLKDEFLSLAAHEIRTPITVIKAQAQLAERFHAQGKLHGVLLEQTLKTFVSESDRLSRLCSDLLDVARVDNGTFAIEAEKFEVVKLVSEVVVKMAMVTFATNRHLIKFNPLIRNAHVKGDRQRTERVLYNLLSNAIRYSPHGGEIEIEISILEHEAKLAVRDHGLGIPPDKISNIFERYYQAHQQGLRGPSGLGLGLNLSREIVRRMGGQISAKSDGLGFGSEFSFTLPLFCITGEIKNV